MLIRSTLLTPIYSPKAPIKAALPRLGDKVSLNPQPLPPREGMRAARSRLGDKVTLNPQPLPPRDVFSYVKSLQAHTADPLASRGIIVVGGRGF